MNKQKGGSVNISDAFESYGLFNSFSFIFNKCLPICRQVLSLLVRSAKRNDSMLFVIPVRVLGLAVECSPPTQWAQLSRSVSQTLHGALLLICDKALGMSLPYSSSTPALYPGTCQRGCIFYRVLIETSREGARVYSSRKIYEESASIGLKAKVRENLEDPNYWIYSPLFQRYLNS